MWKLWLDDDANKKGMEAWRSPPDDTWIVAHSSAVAIGHIYTKGPPAYISFDHDLGMYCGKLDDAMIVCKYLADNHYDAEIDYDIHSRNPEGAKNIRAFMQSWKKSKEV